MQIIMKPLQIISIFFLIPIIAILIFHFSIVVPYKSESHYVIPKEVLNGASIYPKSEIDAIISSGDKGGKIGNDSFGPGFASYVSNNYSKSNQPNAYYFSITSPYSISKSEVSFGHYLTMFLFYFSVALLGQNYKLKKELRANTNV